MTNTNGGILWDEVFFYLGKKKKNTFPQLEKSLENNFIQQV